MPLKQLSTDGGPWPTPDRAAILCLNRHGGYMQLLRQMRISAHKLRSDRDVVSAAVAANRESPDRIAMGDTARVLVGTRAMTTTDGGAHGALRRAHPCKRGLARINFSTEVYRSKLPTKVYASKLSPQSLRRQTLDTTSLCGETRWSSISGTNSAAALET